MTNESSLLIFVFLKVFGRQTFKMHKCAKETNTLKCSFDQLLKTNFNNKYVKDCGIHYA